MQRCYYAAMRSLAGVVSKQMHKALCVVRAQAHHGAVNLPCSTCTRNGTTHLPAFMFPSDVQANGGKYLCMVDSSPIVRLLKPQSGATAAGAPTLSQRAGQSAEGSASGASIARCSFAVHIGVDGTYRIVGREYATGTAAQHNDISALCLQLKAAHFPIRYLSAETPRQKSMQVFAMFHDAKVCPNLCSVARDAHDTVAALYAVHPALAAGGWAAHVRRCILLSGIASLGDPEAFQAAIDVFVRHCSGDHSTCKQCGGACTR